MILKFNEREIDTTEYKLGFDEGCRVNHGDISYEELMTILDISEDQVDFSFDSGDDGLPVDIFTSVDGTIRLWVDLYNEKVLGPYQDKETNMLISEIGEEGIQLLYLFHNDTAEDSDYNEEEFDTLQHLFHLMEKNGHAYSDVKTVLHEYEEGNLRAEETYVLLKIRFSERNL